MSAPMEAPSWILGLLSSCTRLSRVVAATLLSGYVTQLIFPSCRQYLALVAGRTIPCVWNVFTAGLLQTHIVTLAVSILAILVLSKVVEPVWGSKEYIKYLVLVNTASGVSTFFVIYLAYAMDRNNEGNLLYAEVSGFQGILAGLLVALKQTIPDSDVTLLRVIKFRAKHLVSIYVVLSLLGCLVLGGVIKTMPSVLFGAYFGWLYLRIWQVKGEAGLKGDPSDEFRFATFFPEVAQPAVDKVVRVAGAPFGRIMKGSASDDPAKNFIVGGATLPGSDTADASRRRERGARALEERLGGLKDAASADAAHKGDVEQGSASVAAGGNSDPPVAASAR